MEGWIKIHRSLLFSRQFQNEFELKVWMWILCKAYSRDGFATLTIGKGKKTITLKRGQLIFGRKSAEKQLAIDQSMIYRIIQKFEADGCISIQPNTHYSIISVTKYNDFQNNNYEEFDDLEEDRTPIEHPLNTHRTPIEHPTNTNRTPTEHLLNTIKKVNNTEEGKEGEEFEKGKEREGTPAVAAVLLPFTFEPKNEPAEAGESPFVAAVSPLPKNGKARKSREDLLGKFTDIYSRWMIECHRQPAKIDGTQTNAAKALISYFRDIVKMHSEQNQITLSEQEFEKRILDGWVWFLSRWLKLEPHYQDKLTLVEINSKIPNLYKQALNGTAKQQQQQSKSGQGGAAVNQAQRIIDRLNGGAGRT